MSWELLLAWALRWVHIGSAMVLIGGPFFVRFALMPAARGALDDVSHHKLREAINARWRKIAYVVIALFLVTGGLNFFWGLRGPDGQLLLGRWKDFGPEDKRLYHMLFGIKVLAAFLMFFLASALAGRSAAFEVIRKNARVWIGVFLILAVVVITCATWMRYLPLR